MADREDHTWIGIACIILFWVSGNFLTIYYFRLPNAALNQDPSIEYPFSVQVGFGNTLNDTNWACQGFIFDNKTIVTAAHCSSLSDGTKAKYVWTGFKNRSDPLEGQIYEIEKFIPHHDYYSPMTYNDVAVIKLRNEIQFNDNVQPLRIATDIPLDGLIAYAPTWGRPSAGISSDTLQTVLLVKYNQIQCALQLGFNRKFWYGLDPNQACFGAQNQIDTYKGDSGGPVVVIYTSRTKPPIYLYAAVAIVSFEYHHVSVYTLLNNYHKWIEELANSN